MSTQQRFELMFRRSREIAELMKQAAGRPKDLEDLRVLLRLREGLASEGEEDDS